MGQKRTRPGREDERRKIGRRGTGVGSHKDDGRRCTKVGPKRDRRWGRRGRSMVEGGHMWDRKKMGGRCTVQWWDRRWTKGGAEYITKTSVADMVRIF